MRSAVLRQGALARVAVLWLATLTLGAGPAMAVSRDAAIADDVQVQVELPVPRELALGVSRPNGRDMGALDDYIASVGGRAPATWTIWSSWGSRKTRSFPMAAAKGARARGAVAMIWWQPDNPSDPSDCRHASLANIVAGQHDQYITKFALDAKTYQKKLLLRPLHEANGSYFPWTVGNCGNDVPTYLAAWRHIHDIFRRVGAGNVKFVWSMAKKTCAVVAGCNPYLEFYPGDAYVDYMGLSAFNWGAQAGKSWASMELSFRRITQLLGEISDEPIIAVETASSPEGGDKAVWIRDGYPEVYAKFPQVVAIVYLDVDLRRVGHPDWRLGSPPEALQAYMDIVAQPGFRGRIFRR